MPLTLRTLERPLCAAADILRSDMDFWASTEHMSSAVDVGGSGGT